MEDSKQQPGTLHLEATRCLFGNGMWFLMLVNLDSNFFSCAPISQVVVIQQEGYCKFRTEALRTASFGICLCGARKRHAIYICISWSSISRPVLTYIPNDVQN